MPEPSLSEITNIRPENTVNPGVVLDSGAQVVHQLNESAQFNAEMKQRKYSQSLGLLKDIYQDIGQVQGMAIMDEDRPVITKKLAGIFEEIGNDPRNALAGNKYADIQKKLGEARSLATQSKQDNIYDDFHQKYLQSEPELDTPENRAKIEAHRNGQIGKRPKYVLDTPVKFDPEAAMGNILKQKNVGIPYANSEISSDNKFITRDSGTRYDRANALQIWNQGYNLGTDANGQPIKKWAEQQYNKIKKDPSELAKYGNPENAQEFYNKVGEMTFGSKEDIYGEKTSTQIANPYGLLAGRQNNALYMEAVREGNREKLAAVKKNLELQGAPENANFLVRQYVDILGNTTGESKTVDVGGNKYEKEEVISIPHNFLKQWANNKKETLKAGSSLDPVTQTIIEGTDPDLTTRTKDGNVRYQFYQRYKKGDKLPKGKEIGDPVTDQNGNSIIESQGIIPKRSMLATIGAPVVEKKILAASIDQADQFLRGRKNEDMDKINQGDDTPPIQHEKTVPSGGKGKTYNIGGKTFTEDQLQKGAKKYKMTLEQYKASIGIK